MKQVFTLPLIFLVASAALAQRGAVAGHASAGFSSAHSMTHSFSMASPGPTRPVGGVPAYHPNLATPRYGSSYSSPIGPPPFGGTQPNPGHRYPHVYNGNRPYYYSRGVYLAPGYLGYGYYGGYPDDSSSYSSGDQPQTASAYPGDYAQAQPPDSGYEPVPARPPYQPEAAPAAPVPDQPQITLLFKDGRPPQQVQNYAVTNNTLYVLDGERRREIPLDEIDVPQTEKTNRDAGLDFEIPAGVD